MRQRFYHIIFLASLLPGLPISGQPPVSSPLGRFEVDFIRGCAPLTVTITNTSGEINDQYFYDADTCNTASPKYNSTACATMSPVSSTSFTYTQAGTYSLVQVLTNLVPRTDTLIIQVFDPQVPQFEVALCNNYGVMVQINDSFYDQFRIDYGDGSPPTGSLTHTYPAVSAVYPLTVSGYFSNGPVNCADSTINVSPVNNIPASNISQLTVDISHNISGQITLDYILSTQVQYVLETSVNGSSAFTDWGPLTGNRLSLNNLNTTDNLYCFRVAAVDPCNSSRMYSDTICSVNLQVQALNNENMLTWDTEILNFDNFSILKNGAALGSPITSSSVNSFNDTLVACNVNYCYSVSTNYSNGSRSISAEQCVIGINNSAPPGVTSVTASVQGSSISLEWQVPDPVNFPMAEYTVNRSDNNGAFRAVTTGSTLPFIDNNLRPQLNTYCYNISYKDACGNQSPASVTACAILLQGDNPDNKNYILNWTPYVGWANGVREYQLEILDRDGNLIGSPISLGSTVSGYTDIISNSRQITQYRIVALSNDPVPLRSFSNIVLSDIPIQVFLPNSFTPNQDGLNDVFLAKGLFIEEFSMEIYSRWGELLFFSNELDQGWDGIYQGTLVPDGAYVYQITATDSQGRTVTKNGAVHVLKKIN